MINCTFHQATQDEIALIQDLAQNIWRQYYPSIISIEQIEYMLELMYSKQSLLEQMKKNHHFYLAYDNNSAVGFASVSTSDGKAWFLHKFYILPSLHRKGIGTQFLKFLENEVSPETLELTVNRQNYKSINFYFKNGFVIEKVEDFDIGQGYQMNDFVMKKILWLS